MDYFNFWQKWLFVFGLCLIIFGLILAFFSHSTLMNFVFNEQIDPEFWGVAMMPENTAKFQAWVYGILGAVIAGWGIFMAFIAHYPFKAKEAWSWNCIASGFAVWFITDTIITVNYHVSFNAFINILVLLLVLLPLLFTRKYFLKETEKKDF